MTDIDADSGRDFHGLDARQAQAALAEELVNDTEEAQAVSSDVSDESEDKSDDAPANPLWSDEELAEHARMAEALLFAAAEPLDEESIAERLPVGADIAAIIARITEDYASRGVHLQKTDKKWRFVTAGDVAHVLEKEKVTPRRLSRAALETLAIIAYHQPCTRADIEDVRGVAVSKGSLDQLLEIGWARLRGKRRDVPGRPTLYGTTEAFLEHFSLETIQDLPGLADLKAAGLLDARLPPGFSVPAPSDADDEEGVEDGEDAEFAQDFLSDKEDVRPDGDGETVDA